MERKIIISLGSNFCQQESMERAQNMLRNIFQTISFSKVMRTLPIDIESDRFFNCLAFARSKKTESEIVKELKAIQKACGDTPSLRRKSIIKMDLDLLLFGDEKRHIEDWNRNYVKQLIQ